MVDRENKPGQILYLPLKLVQPSSVDRGRLTVQLQELAASIEACLLYTSPSPRD